MLLFVSQKLIFQSLRVPVPVFACLDIETVFLSIMPKHDIRAVIDIHLNLLFILLQLCLDQVAEESMLLAFIVACHDPVIRCAGIPERADFQPLLTLGEQSLLLFHRKGFLKVKFVFQFFKQIRFCLRFARFNYFSPFSS